MARGPVTRAPAPPTPAPAAWPAQSPATEPGSAGPPSDPYLGTRRADPYHDWPGADPYGDRRPAGDPYRGREVADPYQERLPAGPYQDRRPAGDPYRGREVAGTYHDRAVEDRYRERSRDVSGPLPASPWADEAPVSGPMRAVPAQPHWPAGADHDPGLPAGRAGDSGADDDGWDVDDPQSWGQSGSAAILPLGSGQSASRRRDERRRRRGGRRTAPLVALLVITLFLAAGGTVGYHFLRQYVIPPDYSGPGHGTVVVEIKQGQTATDVAQTLFHLGVVASPRAFVKAVEQSTRQTALEPGFYRLHLRMKALLAFQLLLNPAARIQFQVAIPEGLRLSNIVSTLSAKTGIPRSDYLRVLANPGALGLPSYAGGRPEGYLFPATYPVQPRMTATDVLRAMVAQFNAEAAKIDLVATAHRVNLTPSEAVIVASLVQAEGGRVSDYPKIARVIYNRLDAGMRLQLDSTVMYALHTYGILASNQQLQAPSPYNTYLHTGLPPGPIDSPGEAAINAALHPAKGNWLYFVTVNPKTGVTEFTSDPNVFATLRAELEKNLGQGG